MQKTQGNEKWGFIDKNGDFIIKPIYDYVGPFCDNYFPVAIETDNGPKWGVADSEGNLIIKNEYDIIYPFLDTWGRFLCVVCAIEESLDYVRLSRHKHKCCKRMAPKRGVILYCCESGLPPTGKAALSHRYMYT